MIMEIVWWDLTTTDPSIEELTAKLDNEDIFIWSQVTNLHSKYWIAESDPPRWGAVMIWDGEKPVVANLPVNIALKEIGRLPNIRYNFSVKANILSHLNKVKDIIP